MLIGIMGKMGTGKTLSMTILASYLYYRYKVPIHANYELNSPIKSETLKYTEDIWKVEDGIICLDEVWLTLDSRLWQDNVALTRWVNQTRKKRLIVFYTSQHINQVEMRMRNATDILIVCEKKYGSIWLNFVDYQYGTLGRKFEIKKPNRFYMLYDTFQVLEPIISRKWQDKKDASKKHHYPPAK